KQHIYLFPSIPYNIQVSFIELKMNQVNQILHSTNESNNEAESATDDHHNDSSIVETKSMDTNDQSSSVLSRVEKKVLLWNKILMV
ncbi:unnamed protein product, partial [Rotaria sp. Silwood2]